MNVAAHQKENGITGKRKAGEEKKKQAIEQTECLSSAIVQRASRRKMVV